MSLGTEQGLSFDHVGWKDAPSTYIVCTEDLALQSSAQRAWAERATHTIERPWDHSPGVAHPGEVTDLLDGIARG